MVLTKRRNKLNHFISIISYYLVETANCLDGNGRRNRACFAKEPRDTLENFDLSNFDTSSDT